METPQWDHSQRPVSLLRFQCVINLDKHRLIVGKTDKEGIPFVETVAVNEDK